MLKNSKISCNLRKNELYEIYKYINFIIPTDGNEDYYDR